MWTVEERDRIDKQIDRAPDEILKRYEKWKEIAELSGPVGLRLIKGLRDEALLGEWKGYRSSRLGIQWRVIYKYVPETQMFLVEYVTPHDYRRK
jgi:addiction module RelE/StbE family toxin